MLCGRLLTQVIVHARWMSHQGTTRMPNEERDLNNYRPLDLHLWSDHEGVDALVEQVVGNSGVDGNAQVYRRNLRLLLLNLFLSWCDDPEMSVGVSMSNRGYPKRSRYNELQASAKIINAVNHLRNSNDIGFVAGFNDRKQNVGRVSRIWPKAPLINLFENATFEREHVVYCHKRETIVLRNEKKEEEEYDDTDETNRMRALLTEYNSLLERTFIDIPELEDPIVIGSDGKQRIIVSQQDKFVRRIFNNSRWDHGGRFYGGWWQRVPSEYRTRIAMNDQRVIEDDYSGIHIVLLYALEGIDYWTEINADPYEIELPEIGDAKARRSIAKHFLLTAINAETEASAFKATRKNIRNELPDLAHLEINLTDAFLTAVLDQLRERHAPIGERFCSGAGIELMNLDSQITEQIIGAFLEREIPILTIHDSYVVPSDADVLLQETMQAAFEKVTGHANVKIKRDGMGNEEARELYLEARRWQWEAEDFYDFAMVRLDGQRLDRSEGYAERLNKFNNIDR